MTVYIPLLVALVGLLMYFAASNPKVQETGKIMLFCGLLATLLPLGNQMVALFGK